MKAHNLASLLCALLVTAPVFTIAQTLPTEPPTEPDVEDTWTVGMQLLPWDQVPPEQRQALQDKLDELLAASGVVGPPSETQGLLEVAYGIVDGFTPVLETDNSEEAARLAEAAIYQTFNDTVAYLEASAFTLLEDFEQTAGASYGICFGWLPLPSTPAPGISFNNLACGTIEMVLWYVERILNGTLTCDLELVIQISDCNQGPSPTGGSPPPPSGSRQYAGADSDNDADGMGDAYAQEWEDRIDQILRAGGDLDSDGLLNVDEFRWELVPACVSGVYQNCYDNERSPTTGTGGDDWRDGDEVRYWDNDDVNGPAVLGFVLQDPDRLLDTDGDGVRNVQDRNSDDPNANRETLLDGTEIHLFETYPEFADSDCATNATVCTTSAETTGYFDLNRQGSPGTGDGLSDSDEVTQWATLGPGAWLVDADADGIANNLLDPDADNDGLLDSEEFLVHHTNPLDPDTDNDALWDGQEIQAGTGPRDTDSDDDLMPDGWEVEYGLDPRANDGGVDQDLDGYGAAEDAIPSEPWSNLQEYRYHIPTGWNLAASGPWWGGTDPLNPDTDSDGVSDGFEAHFGTDATDGASRNPRYAGQGPSPYGPVSAVDPTNEDLPREAMDPTNLEYLDQGRTDAAEQANETVQVIDHLISAAIAGNVTQALNVLYNETPIGPPLREATQTVQLAQDAILNLVKCAPGASGAIDSVPAIDETVQETLTGVQQPTILEPQPQSGGVGGITLPTLPTLPSPTAVIESVLNAPETVSRKVNETRDNPLAAAIEAVQALNETAQDVDGAAGCMIQTILPFLDALLNRTVEQLPIVDDLVTETRGQTLPEIIGAADAILPIDVQTTQEDLLERPLGTLTETALSLPGYATDPTLVEQVVANTTAAASMLVNNIVKPTSRHPQLFHDRLTAQWEMVADYNQDVYAASGNRVDAISTVDSAQFNLYTNRAGVERITAALVGQRTCVQLDASTATRDASGCDLYVTAVLGLTAVGVPAVVPSFAGRLTPTMKIEKALPSASFDLQALGYFQLPDFPSIAVLGFDTEVPGSPGMPPTLEATLRSITADSGEDRAMAVTFAHGNPTAMPMQVVAAAYRVKANEANKPVVPGYESILYAYSANMPATLALDVASLAERDPAGAQVAIGFDSSAAADLDVWFSETMPVWKSQAAVHGTVAKGASRLQGTFGPQDALSWSWLAQAATPRLDIGFVGQHGAGPERALQLNATSLPSTVHMTGDPSSHRYVLEAGNGASTLAFLQGHGTKECRLSAAGVHRFLFEAKPTSSCAAGRLDHVRSLLVETAENMAHATVTATDSASTSLHVLDGSPLMAYVAGPSQWDSRLALAGNATQAWTWSGNAPASVARFEALVDHESWKNTIVVDAGSVPRNVNATLDAQTGRATLDAAGYIGDIAMALSNTGQAPSTGIVDHIRLRLAGTDPASKIAEASWKATSARSLSTQLLPNGTVEVTGDFQSPRAMSVLFRDASHNLVLNASAAVGRFTYWISEDASVGGITIKQASPSGMGAVNLVGSTPKGRLDVYLDNTPARFTLFGALANETVGILASGPISGLDARYGLGNNAPAAPAGTNALAFLRTGSDKGGFHLRLANVQRLVAHHEAGQVTLSTLFTTGAPLAMQFKDDAEEVLLTVQQPPAQASLTQAAGQLQWTSTERSTFTFKAAAAGPRNLVVESDSAARNLAASWTTPYGDSFTGTITHDADSIPRLLLVESLTAGEPSTGQRGGWKFNAVDLAGRLRIYANPQDDVLDLVSTSASGAAATTGRVTSSYSYAAPTLPVLPTGFQGAALEQTPTSSAAVVSFDAFKSLTLRLAGQGVNATEPSHINLQRSSAGNVAFHALSERTGTDVGIEVTNAASTLDLVVQGGGASHDVHIDWTAVAASGPARMRLVSRGQDIAFHTQDLTPTDFTLDWTSQTPFDLQTSQAFTPFVQFAETLDNAPYFASHDFAAITLGSGADAPPRVGVKLTGTTGFLLDAAGRRLVSTDEGSVVPFQADYREPNLGFQVVSSDLPTSLSLIWDPVERDFAFTTSEALQSIQVSHYPASDKSPRMFFALDDSAAGSTTFNQDLDAGTFALSRPQALGQIQISLDNGGTGLLRVLTSEGLFLDLADAAKVFLVNLHNVQSTSGSLNAQESPQFTASGEAGPGLGVRMNNGGQRITATLSGRNAGATSLAWPDPDNVALMRFSAQGVAGRAVAMTEVVGGDSAQASLTASPDQWTVDSSNGRTFDYAGLAASTGTLRSSGSWHESAFNAIITQPGTTLHVTPAADFASGIIQSSGGTPNRLTVSLTAPGGGTGLLSTRASGGDVLSVDSTENSGTLYVSLPKPVSVSWDMARLVEGRSAVAADLNLAVGTTAGMALQFVDAQQQTLYRLPNGAPAATHLNLGTTESDWKLHIDSAGKTVKAQQQAPMGTLSVLAQQPPAILDVAAQPSSTTPFEARGSQATGSLQAETQWAGASLKANLAQMPTAFKATLNGAVPSTGLITTQGTGSVGLADLLLIPGGTTANRYKSTGDQLAVAATGNTPYVAVRAKGFNEATWNIPETGNLVMEGKLSRSASVAGLTTLVFEGPAQDITAKIQGAAAVVGIAARQNNVEPGTSTSQPITMTYTSTGGISQRFDVTHVDSGHTVSSHIAGASGVTTIQATGAEPARINVVAQTVQGGLGFKSTDLDVALNLQVKNTVPPRLLAEVQRGTCGTSSPDKVSLSTQGTGTAGPTLLQIGDQRRVPADRASNYAIVNCKGATISVGARTPFVTDLLFAEASCKGFQAKVPANTPMPIEHSDETGDYSIHLRSQEAAGGTLNIVGNCNGLEYWFNSTTGGPATIADLQFDYNRVVVVPPPGDDTEMQCLSFDKSCINRMIVTGAGLPSHVEATFHGPNGPQQSGLLLTGGSGNRLDVRLIVAPKPPPKDPTEEEIVDLAVHAVMALQELRFFKSTSEETRVDDATPNMIVHYDDPGRDALFVKLEKLYSVNVDLWSDPANKVSRMTATYGGESHRAFDFHAVDKNCAQRRAVISNLPAGLSFDLVLEEKAASYVTASQSTEQIRELKFASQGGNSCENPDKDGEVVFAELRGIPAGWWTVQWLFGGASGLLRAQASGGPIGHLEAGRAAIGHDDRYMMASLNQVSLSLDWDLDGDTRYEGSPSYFYCDTAGIPSSGVLRARHGRFAIGLIGPEAAGLQCENFQLRWGIKQVAIFCLNCGAPTLPLPWFGFTGAMLLRPGLKGEVLYADQWWNVPWDWLENDE